MNPMGPPWRFRPSIPELAGLIFGALAVFWYAWLMDDAYVYFRYVDNWILHGHGLVWNPGEYVEGFSSPLWALLLGGLRWLRLDYWVIVRGMALLGFAAFWYLACLVNRGLMAAGGRADGCSHNLPLVYLTFTYAVACYFSSGLESPLVNISAAAYAAAILWPQSLVLQVLVGVAPLVRHEFALPFCIFLAWSLFVKRSWPITAILASAITVGGYGLFRIWYYADLLPNTFYLKDTTSIVQGLAFVYDSLLPYFTIPYLLATGLVFWVLRRQGCDSLQWTHRLVMIAVSFSVGAYVVKIGGDPRHFRYLAFPYILLILATGGLVERLAAALPPVARRYATAFLLIFGLSVALCYPRQLRQHPVFRSHAGFKHMTFLRINDAASARFNPAGITPPWYALKSYMTYGQSKERVSGGKGDLKVGREIWHSQPSAIPGVPLIADHWCQTAFLHPGSPVIHSLGLTEPFLARTRMCAARTAHKWGLLPLAKDIAQIRAVYGFKQGAFDQAIADGAAPEWVERNIAALRIIEKKAYNQNDFLANLRLAFLPRVTIDPGATRGPVPASDGEAN